MQVPMRWTLLILVAISMAPGVAAQDCSPEAPCPLGVNTDPDEGFYWSVPGETEAEVTAGDTFTFEAWNWYDEDHVLSIAALDISFVAEGFDSMGGPSTSAGPFTLDAPGTYELLDETTGETVTLRVLEGDVVEGGSTGEDSGHEDTPGLPAAVLIGAFSLLAYRRR